MHAATPISAVVKKAAMGGPHAPGTPEDATNGMMKTLDLPWEVTGEFYKDGLPIPW